MSDAVTHSREVIEHKSRSFALASRFLPRDRRDDAVVLYAWCRHADDLVDESADEAAARAGVDQLHGEIAQLYGEREPDDPFLARFRRVIEESNIPRIYLEELVAGVAMDTFQSSYASLEELHLYCYRVAGVVGLMMSHVMRVRDDAALQQAVHLGMAMQLTNICRDVLEDWGRDRLYLPDELLRGHGAKDLAGRLGGPFPSDAKAAISRTMRDILAEADRLYASGYRGLPALGWRCSLAIRLAGRVYASIGERIAQLDYDPERGRAVVGRRRKIELVIDSMIRALGDLFRQSRTRRPRAPQAILTWPQDILPLRGS